MICRDHGVTGWLDSLAHALRVPTVGPFAWLHEAHNKTEYIKRAKKSFR